MGQIEHAPDANSKKGPPFGGPRGVTHRRGAVRTSFISTRSEHAVTLVTVRALSRRACLNPNQVCELANQVFISRPAPSGGLMDTLSLREKAALCLRIARGLSWNNPSRLQLADLADRFDREAKEIESQDHPARQTSMLANPLGVTKS